MNGEVAGLIVLNFDLRQVFIRLDSLQKQNAHWLINPDGFFLAAPNDTAWGWLLDRPENQVSMQFPGFESRFNGNENQAPDAHFHLSIPMESFRLVTAIQKIRILKTLITG